MKMQRRKSKGIARVSAWVLSLAMMLSLVSVPMKVKAEDIELSLNPDTAVKTVALSGDNATAEVRFDTPSAYPNLKALADAGYSQLQIGYAVTAYTPGIKDGVVQTAGVQPFVNFGASWKTGSVWNNLSDSATGTVTLDFSAISTTDTQNVVFGIQFANITGSITYQITSARLIGGSAGNNSGGSGEGEEVTSSEVSVVATKVPGNEYWAEWTFAITNHKAESITGVQVVLPVSVSPANLQAFGAYEAVYDSAVGGVVVYYAGTIAAGATLSSSDNKIGFNPNNVTVTEASAYVKSVNCGAPSASQGGIGDGSSELATDIEYNYAKLLQESLYFYDANMCGGNVEDRSEFSWRKNCHTEDATATYDGQTVDVSGGYHDAGDHAKFGLPQAYTASTLGMSYYEFKDAFADLELTDHYKRIMDHFVEYFMNCTVLDNSGNVKAFCYQVGSGNTDHSYWGEPQNQPSRSGQVYFTSASAPCTDIVCETAAALAIYYCNFKTMDSEKALQALDYAKKLFAYANNNTLAYSVIETDNATGKPFYQSTSYDDDFALAAAWLYKATNDSAYATYYNNVYGSKNYVGWALSWDDVGAAAMLYAPDSSTTRRDYVSSFIKSNYNKVADNNYFLLSEWGSARYNCATQFMGLVYDKMAGSDVFGAWAIGQMKYLLGNNAGKHAFVVGYNKYSVSHPHHRAASGYSDVSSNASTTMAHVLAGALVGGPRASSTAYTDLANDYVQNEVALDYNAGLVGAAAGLYLYTMNNGTEEEKAIQKTVAKSEISNELREVASSTEPATPAGKLVADKTSITLDTLTYGYASSSTATISLENTGDATAVGISPRWTTGTYFETTTNPMGSLAAGYSTSITVAPKLGLSAGTYKDTLVITYDSTKTVSITVSVTIAPKPITDNDLTFPTLKNGLTIKVGDTLSNDWLSKTSDTYGTYAWEQVGTTLTTAGNQEHKVKFTVTNSNYSYSGSGQNLTFTVKSLGKLQASLTIVEFANLVYDYSIVTNAHITLNNVGDLAVNNIAASLITGTAFTVLSKPATILTTSPTLVSIKPMDGLAAGTYSDTLVITSSENTLYIPITLTVEKAQNIAVAAPTLQARNANSISVIFADAAVTQQYAIVTSGAQVQESDWKDCTGDVMTITGLTPCTNYEIYARAKADNNHYVGASSEVLNVLTLVENPYAIDVSQITSRDCDYVKALVAVENGVETPTVSVTEENGKLVVTLMVSGQPYTIMGDNANINVNTGKATNVVLSNTTINQLVIASTSAETVMVSTVGTNTITSGIQVLKNGEIIAPVKITSEKTADSTYAGSLKVTNESGAAISSEGSVEIAGGYVDLTASGAAIEAGSIIVTGGSIKAETTGDGSVFDATDKIELTGGAITTVKPENSTANDFAVTAQDGKIITDGVAITGEPTFSKEPVDQNGQTVVMVLVTFTDDTGASLTSIQVKKGADLNLADVKVLAADGVTDYAISKPGYELSWKYNQNTYTTTGTIANITDAITLQAVWTFITYPIEKAVISDIANQTYTGAALTPKVTVTYDSKTLLQDTHYTVSYSDNVNAGTATVTISGLGAYVGTVQKTFAILPKSISGMNASLAADTYAYTGDEVEPKVTLMDGNTTLVRDVHYTVTYTNNINAGTATAVIVGKGNYTGQITLAFTIYEVVTTVDIADVEISEIADQIYTGKPITPSLVLSYNGTVLTQGVDYDVQYTNNVNVGEATVTIIGKGDFVGSTEETFDIIIKKNKKYTKGNYQYQITSAKTNGKGTVQLVKCVKKSKTANIAATVNIGGVNFKITSIKANAFKNNKTMTKLVIGKNVTSIGDKAFYGCTKLKNATIGKGVKKIGKQAFYNCKAMKKLVISTSKLKTSAIGSKAFTKMGASNYKKLVVKVPKKKLSAYKKMLKKKGLSSKAKIKK